MNLDDLRIFVAVVREGGMAAASRTASLPKSTLSRGVARLEKQLGIRLLQRSPTHIVPTQEGLRLYEKSAHLLQEIEGLLHSVGRASLEPCGALRLSAPRDFEGFLAPVISRYARTYPASAVEVMLSDRFVDLVEEGYDLAIRGGSLPKGDFTLRKWSAVERVFCASPTYLAAQGAPRTPHDLLSHLCITTGEKRVREWPIASAGEVLRIEGHLHANTVNLARTLVLDGRGIAMLPTWLVADDLRQGRLQLVLPQHCPPPAKLWIVYPSGKHMPARVRTFITYLLDEGKSAAGWKVELSSFELS